MLRSTTAAVLLACCATARPDLGAALHAYERATEAMDNAAIAASFAPDGELVNGGAAQKGPAAIRAFLDGFAAFRVLASTLEPTRTTCEGERCTQEGTFFQRVTLPTKETVEARGSFVARWRMSEGRWLLERLETFASPRGRRGPVRHTAGCRSESRSRRRA